MKRLIKVLVLAGLIALAVLGVSKLRALLGSHVFVPDAVDSANENHPPTEDDPLYHLGSPNDVHVPGGGETADGFVIPAYEGEEIVPIHNNVPDFSAKEISTTEFLKFSELDDLGRVGRAEACIGPSMLATEERGSIGMIKPAGWHTAKYEFIDGLYLYNRCHLIAYSLCGVNADERNLMTGTRYLNIEGMLGIENRVYWYVRDTGNHVCYRVTPRYIGDNLLADGVQMEAYSVEDHGKRISLNVFCYNVQTPLYIILTVKFIGNHISCHDQIPVFGGKLPHVCMIAHLFPPFVFHRPRLSLHPDSSPAGPQRVNPPLRKGTPSGLVKV